MLTRSFARFAAFALLQVRTHAEPLVLTNARVYTGNDNAPRAEAVIAIDGRITFVGSAAAARAQQPSGARVIDLAGLTVLPGLVDAHAHLAGVGFRELNFNLEGANGIADVQAKLKARAATTPRGQWIVGRGWIESKWTPPAFPRAPI
jgi:predicted amidohydrolase YtcJ